MRILFISNAMPDAKGGGLAKRMANHLRSLHSLGEVTLIVPPQADTMSHRPDGVRILERGLTVAEQIKSRHEVARTRLSRAVYSWRRRNMIDARATPADLMRFRRELAMPFDLVFAGRLGNAVWWESVSGPRPRRGELCIVDFDDIESRMLAKWNATILVSPFWTWKLGREVNWLRRLEARIAMSWDAVLLCSRIDAERLREATGEQAWIVPNGYDMRSIVPETTGEMTDILFVGSFEYFPNSQGVEWFVREIWPRVRAALGDTVRLGLVGLNATPQIIALGGRDAITVTSNAPSVDPFYDSANIVVAPLLAGSGTRIKLIEAAAKGRAIVTTERGCEGLGFVDGVHAEIADDPADFAARIIALARDPARRTRLVSAARALAEGEFSADALVDGLKGKIAMLATGAGVGGQNGVIGSTPTLESAA